MKKIWFDVTSILNWHRPAVGIIRVEVECAKFALKHLSGRVEFCCFRGPAGFVRVEPTAVRAALARIGQRPAPTASSTPASLAALSGIEARARSIVLRFPGAIRDPLYRYLSVRREAVRTAGNGLRELRRAAKAWVKPLPETSAWRPARLARQASQYFSKDSVYVSLGLDWDQKDLTFLAAQKLATRFKALLFCYDVIPVKYPHLCVADVSAKFARYFADVSWCADEILCISECTKRDLLALLDELGAPKPPATVIKLGSNILKSNVEEVSAQTFSAAGDRFILFVSTIERRKNHETVYRAYTRLVDQGERNLPKLVFVGMPGWGVADFLADIRFDPRVAGCIEVLTNVSDEDLVWLYEHALFTVFPSLYEGWGLAVGESLANGKFCLASNAGSIPEVGGDLIEYLDPWDVPKWAERMAWYIRHPEELARAETRIREQYVVPTWESTARSVFERAEALLPD